MMIIPHLTSSKKEIKYIIREIIYFFCFFLYVWLRINPVLYNQNKDPVFLSDFGFFKGFLNYPGGLTDYAASLLSQLYYFPVLGALVVTATVWAICRLTAMLIQAIWPDHPVHVVHYLPSILLIILHSTYRYPLATSLSLIISLLFVFIQFRIGKDILLRIISYLVFGLILYYAAAGLFFLFALMCALYEALCLRRPILSAIYLLIAITIPYIAKETIFLINDQMAYLYLLPFQESYKPAFVPYLLILLYPILFLIYHPFILERFDFLKKLKLRKSWLQYGLQTLILFTVAGLTAAFSYDKDNHLLLQVDYYARHERWQDIIRISEQEQSDLLSVTFQTNRALFHTGQLLENMFSFPQSCRTSGLFLPFEFSKSWPLQESDFCYDLGSINESKHWAQEALGTHGETPWILKRLAIVNFACGDLRATEHYLNVLDKTFFFKSWSQEFRKKLQNPSLALEDETLNRDRSMLLKSDFVIIQSHPSSELDSLLKENPKNKMAFEYRIARELLSCLLGDLPKHIELLNNFDYHQIPKHIEESLIGLWMISGKREVPPVFRYIRNETVQRFRDFNQVMTKFHGDRKAAKSELQQRFGNTYWFFMIYNNPMIPSTAKESYTGGGGE